MIQWLQLPLWLMQLHLTPAACIVYALIANRHRLSVATNAQSGTWSDDQGVYCIYPRAELAAAAGLSITTISRAMRELVAAGLIIDRRLGQGLPNHLYIVDQATTATLDPVPDIQRADQLLIDDLMSDYPDTTTPAAEQATPAAEQATPAAEQAAPAAEQAAPDLHDQDTPATEQAAPDQRDQHDQDTPASIEGTTIQESQLPRLPYKKMIKKNYSDRSNRRQPMDKLSAIRRCLSAAYGIDPDTVTHDQYTTAQQRTANAHAVRNPVTYAASIIAQLVTSASAAATPAPLTDTDREWIASVMAYQSARAVV